MLDRFIFNVYLPSIKDYVRVSELTNKEYINILKFNKNNDTRSLADYLEWLIISKTDQDINFHRIDKFCILLTLIMVNISSAISLTGKCEETEQDYEVHVDVADILNMITNVDYQLHEITHGDVRLTLNYPTSIISDNPTIQSIVNNITVDGQVYNVCDMTETQFNQVIGSLPGKMFKKIVDAVKDIKDKYTDITLLDVFSPYVDEPIHTVLSVDLIGNSLYEFICTLFGSDLNGFYELQFAMLNNYKFPPEYYMSITPTEVKTFYGYMKTDVEKKNKHIEQMQNNKKSPIDGATG